MLLILNNSSFPELILHAGHVKYLQKSSKCGDVLIVGLNSDMSVKRLKGESRPINNENDRAFVLSALEAVDYVVIFEEDTPINLIKEIKPNIYTKGADYNLETLAEAKEVLNFGGKVEFIEFVEGKSTTNIIQSIKK